MRRILSFSSDPTGKICYKQLECKILFRENVSTKGERTWTGWVTSGQLSSYIERILIRRIYLDLFGRQSLEMFKNHDHKLFFVSFKWVKAKVRQSSHSEFSTFLLDEKDFQDQQELMLKRQLTDAMIGYR